MMTVNQVYAGLDHEAFKDVFSDAIFDKVEDLKKGGFRSKRKGRKLERLVDTDEEFQAQYELAIRRAINAKIAAHTGDPTTLVFTQGDFLDWFKDGGWETLLKFFEGLLEIIMKYFAAVAFLALLFLPSSAQADHIHTESVVASPEVVVMAAPVQRSVFTYSVAQNGMLAASARTRVGARAKVFRMRLANGRRVIRSNINRRVNCRRCR